MTKNFKNSQVFHRMNFLSQCQEALMESDPAVSNLQAFYGHTLHILSRRTQSKMYPSLKRSMCKKCSTLLVPGTNATLRTRGRKGCKRMVITCRICGTIKRLPCAESKPRKRPEKGNAIPVPGTNEHRSEAGPSSSETQELKRKNSKAKSISCDTKKPRLDPVHVNATPETVRREQPQDVR